MASPPATKASSNINVDIDESVTAGAKASESNEARVHAATVATDKVMSVSANLAQLLPTGSVLAYQSLSASFTNQGECLPSNRCLSLGLVVFLSAACVFFAFTDSITYKGKVYYGVAMKGRLNLFNLSKLEEKKLFTELKPELEKRGLSIQDFVHGVFSAVVFLTVAASDVGLQNCFFPHVGKDGKELFKNMPLGMALLSSFVFMIFPTKRRGIGSHCADATNGSYSMSGEKEKKIELVSTSRVINVDMVTPEHD
uniref:Uncharacterized protein n=1 Tax=Leersia perrieri TaxID=77586 RepID=A0A0D9XYV7_9ORYZ